MTDKKLPFTVLGFDYGSKTTGVAVGQSLTGTASELAVIRFGETRQSQKTQWEQLKKTILEWRPAILVVGWPLNMDGTESVLCADVKLFSEQLQANTGRKIALFDERLTSREAKMADAFAARDYRKNPVDAEAARLLLESWLRAQG